MKRLFETKVVSSENTTRSWLVTADGRKPIPDPVLLSIVENDDGSFCLFREDNDGIAIADTWHESVEEAKHQADFEYEIAGW